MTLKLLFHKAFGKCCPHSMGMTRQRTKEKPHGEHYPIVETETWEEQRYVCCICGNEFWLTELGAEKVRIGW